MDFDKKTGAHVTITSNAKTEVYSVRVVCI